MIISKKGCFSLKWMQVLLLILVSMHKCFEGCQTVSLNDAIIAARASKFIYQINSSLIGITIPETSFVIQKVISLKYMGQPLKALVANDSGTTIIAFQGAKTKRQLLQEFKAALDPPIKVKLNKSVVGVLPFFWEAYNTFEGRLQPILGLESQRKYILTGHSFGGALAALLAIYATTKEELSAIWKHPQSSLITFGEPRVGDADYAALHDKYISPQRKLRFVNDRDIVPHVPPHFLNYYHHSREIWIRSRRPFGLYGHTEVFWIACPFNDIGNSTCCNNRHFRTIFDHSSSKYLKALTSKPKGFVDRFKNIHETFLEALCA